MKNHTLGACLLVCLIALVVLAASSSPVNAEGFYYRFAIGENNWWTLTIPETEGDLYTLTWLESPTSDSLFPARSQEWTISGIEAGEFLGAVSVDEFFSDQELLLVFKHITIAVGFDGMKYAYREIVAYDDSCIIYRKYRGDKLTFQGECE